MEFIGISNLGQTAYKAEKCGQKIRIEKYNFTWGHFVGLFSMYEFKEWAKSFAPKIDAVSVYSSICG